MAQTSDTLKQGSKLSQTKKDLAQSLLQKWLSGDYVDEAAQPSAIKPYPRKGSFPLSAAQERMWFLEQLEPESGYYNMAEAVRLSGQLNLAALEQSLQQLITRHESLRTVFEVEAGRPAQVIKAAEEARLDLKVIDHSGLEAEEQEAKMKQVVAEASSQGFDMSRGPLMRVVVITQSQQEHVLVVVMHHIISDGWSMGVFVGEFVKIYESGRKGEASRLGEMKIQYADYAMWQREQQQQEERNRQMEYWKQELAGAARAVRLNKDREGQQAAAASQGAREWIRMSAAMSQKVREESRKRGMSVYMMLLGGLEVMLRLESGQQEIVVGTRIAGRSRVEVEGVIGYFVNALVMRGEIRQEMSIEEVMEEVKRKAVKGYENQEVAFEEVVKEMKPERGQKGNPLFNVMFVVHKLPIPNVESHGLKIRPVILDGGDAKYDLDLTLTDNEEHISGWVEYSRAEFDATTMRRMMQRYERVIEQMVEEPSKRVCEIEMLSESERHQVVIEYNDTGVEDDEWQSPARMFVEQARRAWDAVAVVSEGKQVSYGELERRSNQVARYLKQQGVGLEQSVGVMLRRSEQVIEVMLGVMKAGGVYVPMEADNPRQQQENIVRQAKVEVIVTQESEQQKAEGLGARVVVMERDEQQMRRQSQEEMLEEVSERNLAYIVYTTGSTGEPKGVAIEQGQLMNRLKWMWERYEWEQVEVMCQRTMMSFSVAIAEQMGGLLKGVKTAVISEQGMKDTQQLIEEMKREEVTRVVVVPSLLRAMLEEMESKGRRLVEELKSVKIWSVCGEEMSREDAERMGIGQARAGARGVKVINQYGSSEMNDVSSKEITAGEEVGIGRGIRNMRMYVMDERKKALGIGMRGEVYASSGREARGYVGAAAESASRLEANSESEEAGARMYRMGDIGRWDKAGEVRYEGRSERVVKVRGMRVEVEAVERVMREVRGVKEAAVVSRQEEARGAELVGYVVKKEEEQIKEEEIRREMRKRLADYMVPAQIVELEQMPKTSNGKIDRRALEKIERRVKETVAGQESRTKIEQEVGKIWEEVMRREGIGVREDFFEIGGHSLLATQVVGRVRQKYEIEITLKSLFDAPTIADMARVVIQEKSKQSENVVLSSPLKAEPDPEGRFEPFPLTDIQQAYWVGRSGAFDLGNVAAHSYFEIEVPHLDLQRMNHALRRLIDRHDMLRTIVLTDGRQQILRHVPDYRIEANDLRSLNGDADAELEKLRHEMSHQVLPSDRWPLFDIRASALNDDLVRLHLSFDLLISDAWSWQILAREFFYLYQIPEAELEPLEFSFRDYVLAELSLKGSPMFQRSLSYWQARLPELPPAPQLPLAQNPASLQKPTFNRFHHKLGPEQWSRLKLKAASEGLTPSGLLLAAFSEILATWSKSPRFTINLTLFNRIPVHRQVNDIVGDFTSLTLLAIDNSADAPFNAKASRIQQQLWEDLDNRFVGGIQILRELSRFQESGTRATMPVVFTSTLGLDGSNHAAASTSLAAEVVYSVSQTPQVWLDHQVHEHAGSLIFNWDFVESLFPDNLIEEMFAAYLKLLERLADDDSLWQAAAIQCVPQDKLNLYAEINSTASPLAAELLQELFTGQVAERPNHPAVIAGHRALTYEELSRFSNRVAHRLRELGATPGHLVAIVMEKGWEQVVAALGILNAGAAYLPIDPEVPKERFWYLLDHAQVSIALTQPWIDDGLEWPDSVTRVRIEDGSLNQYSDSSLEPSQSQSDLAYVIYTSGSTGLPKGVMIDHRGAVNTVLDINALFDISPEDRVLALSSLSFDLSVYDIFGTLGAGATIVIPIAGTRKDPAHWFELMSHHNITIWNSVPSLMNLLVEYLASRGDRLPRSLRVVMMSGDWIPVKLPGRIRELSEDARIISLGGATEASIWSILYPVEEVSPEWKSIPYGRPMKNQQFHVMDERLEARPVWVPGQLYIGGVGLARGYWRDAEKTAASFVIHPRTGERLYRTGDLGRYLPDGDIEFLGREDFQVKVQGFRIELAEVEAALSQHPALSASVVAVSGEARSERRLVAYAVPGPGETITATQLRDFLKEKLPEYMIPSNFITLDSLPLSRNGKVDRKALPDPSTASQARPDDAYADRGNSLSMIGQLVESYLGIENIEPEANLLDLGASSVDMIRIANLLEKELRFRPSIEEFYRVPTLMGLAQSRERSLLAAGISAPAARELNESGKRDNALDYPVIMDPQEREQFKKQQPGLRRDDQAVELALPDSYSIDERAKEFASRRSYRKFIREPLAFSRFSQLIASLRQMLLNGEPKYLYPSAGGLYPVQTYVHVRPGRVEGITAGVFYYHPQKSALIRLSPEADLPASIHDPFINRPVYEGAAFSLFFIAQMAAIGPMYGGHSMQFATLEAGYMSQLLMMKCAPLGIGLCPIGIVDFDQVRHLFNLDDSHVLLHSLLGGAIEPHQDEHWESLQENYQGQESDESEREEFEL